MSEYMKREDYCEENCGKENHEKYGQWISVDDRLPKIDERVLVCIPKPDNHYNTEIAYISKGNDDYPYWVLRDKSQFYSTRFHYISYWMPLPELPKKGDTEYISENENTCTRHLCGICDNFSVLRADGEPYQYSCTIYNKAIPAISAIRDVRPKDFRD